MFLFLIEDELNFMFKHINEKPSYWLSSISMNYSLNEI